METPGQMPSLGVRPPLVHYTKLFVWEASCKQEFKIMAQAHFFQDMSQADLCLVDSVANAPPPFPGITTTAAVHDSSSPAPTQMDHGKPANETSPINQPLVCFPSFLQNFDHFFLLQTTISMGTLKVCFAHSSLECDVVSNISWLEFCYQYLEFF